jgi:hypothetical protein
MNKAVWLALVRSVLGVFPIDPHPSTACPRSCKDVEVDQENSERVSVGWACRRQWEAAAM